MKAYKILHIPSTEYICNYKVTSVILDISYLETVLNETILTIQRNEYSIYNDKSAVYLSIKYAILLLNNIEGTVGNKKCLKEEFEIVEVDIDEKTMYKI